MSPLVGVLWILVMAFGAIVAFLMKTVLTAAQKAVNEANAGGGSKANEE